jgi:hypothetical protein
MTRSIRSRHPVLLLAACALALTGACDDAADGVGESGSEADDGSAEDTAGGDDGDDGDETGDDAADEVCETPAGGEARCADGEMSGGDPDPVSFNDDLQPIFSDNCLSGTYSGGATSCHQPEGIDATAFGIELDLRPGMALASLCGEGQGELCERAPTKSDEPFVVPGDPCGSFLWRKLDGCTLEAIDGEGLSMPYLGDRLSKEQVDLVWTWIEQGAGS